jgi:tetratricopeptide (TPR) repeat protein
MPAPSGAFESAKPIAAAARGSGIFGMGFVDNISLGHNPYGRDDRFASAFVGYLKIAKSGRYRIFTVSDDASYVFLEGKPLCSWPGRHEVKGGRHGKHGRDLDLQKGLYRIEYYHAEDKETQIMALGWKPPGSKAVEVVPHSAFLHTPVARAGAPERRGDAPLAAFDWQQTDQMLYQKRQYTRVSFANQCGNVPEDARVEWSFSDGVTASGAQPRDHIYIGDGPFTCSLRIVGKDRKVIDQFRCVVRIGTALENLTAHDEQPLREYIDTIARYACTRVPAATLKALWALVEISKDVKSVRPFCAAMVRQFGLDGAGWHAGDRLALALSIKEPEKAVKLYARLAAKAPSRFDAARVRMERIELVLHKLKHPDRALALAKALRDKNTGWMARLGAVKVGDVYRAKGGFEEAEKAYRAAAKVAYGRMDRRLVAMRQGGYLETVETYVRTGFLRAARELLVRWEADYPDGKLGGDLILMTAKYFEKLGDPQRALDELTTLTKINPLSPYLPEIELRMARAHARLGDRAKANTLYDRVINEYPRSDAARQAQRERY